MESVSDYLVEHAAEAALWGYVIVFLLTFLETSALVGLVVPGETTVILASALASQGVMRLPYLMIVVAVGAILGDSVGYVLGRKIGRDLILRHPRFFRVKPGHLARADGYFARYGGLTILLGRWVGFLRSLAPLLAGSARMSYGRFAVYDIAGCVTWAIVLCLAGYAFGESYKLIERRLGQASLFLAILLVTVVLFYFLGRWLWKRRAVLGGVGSALAEAVLHWRPLVYIGRRLSPQLTWIARRFSPGQTFGLVLTIGLLATVLLSWAVVTLVWGVLTRQPVTLLDLHVVDLMSKYQIPWLTEAMRIVVWLGSIPVVVGLATAVSGLLVWRNRVRDALVLLSSVLGAVLLAEVLSILTGGRGGGGALIDGLLKGSDRFPSTFGAGAVALCMTTALLATGWVRLWETRVYVLLGGTALVLLVGFSRLYLAADIVSSLLAGYAVGALWLTVSVTAGAVWERARWVAVAPPHEGATVTDVEVTEEMRGVATPPEETAP